MIEDLLLLLLLLLKMKRKMKKKKEQVEEMLSFSWALAVVKLMEVLFVLKKIFFLRVMNSIFVVWML